MPLAHLYKRPADLSRAEHISHLVGDGNYSHVHFVDGSKATFSRTLRLYQTQFPVLIRISKALLVNPASITDWERRGATHLRLRIAETEYWVARRRVNEVMGQLTQALATNQSLSARGDRGI